MKFLLIAFALIGIAAAALPDSATQGPNPQDIATPEPEYIDIDLPEPPKPKAAPVQRSFAAPRPVPQPITSQFSAPSFQHRFAPQQQHQQQQQHAAPSSVQQRFAPQQQVVAHNFNTQAGYQYRRPVYVRRVYYHRRF